MQPQQSSYEDSVSHYSVLGLPLPSSNGHGSITRDGLRNAYRKALLLNHPDKFARNGSDPIEVPDARESYHRHSIDKILLAYQTLADPRLKTEYDQKLLSTHAQRRAAQQEKFEKGTHAGVDVHDLEDLNYNEENGFWSRSCRCGDGEGYILTEQDLEHEIKEGEIFVGCRGCSLFIKVLFAAEGGDDEEESQN